MQVEQVLALTLFMTILFGVEKWGSRYSALCLSNNDKFFVYISQTLYSFFVTDSFIDFTINALGKEDEDLIVIACVCWLFFVFYYRGVVLLLSIRKCKLVWVAIEEKHPIIEERKKKNDAIKEKGCTDCSIIKNQAFFLIGIGIGAALAYYIFNAFAARL